MPVRDLQLLRHRAGLAWAVFVLSVSVPLAAIGTTRSWNNPAGGSAATTTNWSPNGTPGSGDLLMFNLNSSYIVSWASPADTAATMNLDQGHIRFNIASLLGIQGQVIADADSFDLMTGKLDVGHLLIGSGGTGHVLVTTNGTRLVTMEATGSYIGDGGTGHLWVNGGARFQSNGFVDMAFGHADQCSTTVIGGNFLLHEFSAIQTLTTGGPSIGDVTVGDSGNAVFQMSNGGFATVAGNLFVGRHSPGTGLVDIFNSPTGLGTPSLTVQGTTYIGSNPQGAGHPPGTGTLRVEKGFAALNGVTHIGGGGIGSLVVRNGASLSAVGITVASPEVVNNSNFHVRGGGTVASVLDSLDVGLESLTGLGSAYSTVDSGATLTMLGGAPIHIGYDGEIDVIHASTLTSTGDIDVSGNFNVAGSVQAHRVSLVHSLVGPAGFTNVAGTIAAKISVGTSMNLVCYQPNGGSSRSTIGDSSGTDGFVSTGSTILGPDTLTILDQDLADLGNLYMGQSGINGVLILPHGGKVGAGDSLFGYGVITGALVNEGAVNANSGRTLTVNGGYTQLLGYADGGGTFIVAPGNAVSARGMIATPFQEGGALDFGPTPARLRGSSFTITSAGASSRFRLGSKASGIQDTLTCTGPVTLAGTLDIGTLYPNPPVAGDTLTIVTGSAISGTFSSVTLNGGPSAAWLSVIYAPTTVKVAIKKGLAGVMPGEPGATKLQLRLTASGTVTEPAFALDLPVAAQVRVAVYDVSGRQVGVLKEGRLDAGHYQFRLSNAGAGMNGVYFGRAEVSEADGTPRKVLSARVVRVR